MRVLSRTLDSVMTEMEFNGVDYIRENMETYKIDRFLLLYVEETLSEYNERSQKMDDI